MDKNKLVDRAKAENTSVRTLVVDAIRKAGSQTGAAALLGVNPNTVRYHVRRLKLKVKTSYAADVAALA